MSVEENKELARRYCTADANEMRKSMLGEDKFHALDCKFHGMQGVTGLKEYNQTMETILTAFPDCKYVVEEIIAEGDKVVVRYTFTGTNNGPLMGLPATGKKVINPGVGIFKISGGRLIDVWFIADQMSIMQQLGLVPKQKKEI
jgi:steroid delta-isomerase-like uncharacterized protein